MSAKVEVSTREGTKLGFVFDQVDDRGCMISEIGAGALRRHNDTKPEKEGLEKPLRSGVRSAAGLTSLRPDHPATRRGGQQGHRGDAADAPRVDVGLFVEDVWPELGQMDLR